MNKTTLSKLSLVLAAGAIPAVNAIAGVFVITDDACPAAYSELEAHLNWEAGIMTNHSRSIENGIGLEFAYGATETLEVAASLDFGYEYMSSHYARKTGAAGKSDYFNLTGFSLGLKNQILDPEAEGAAFGLAFVGGFSYAFANADSSAARTVGFELGLNFQKNLMDGDLILAFTPGVAFETDYDYTAKAYGDTITYALAFGASYQVADGLRVGFEGSYEISYSDNFDDDAFYLGPNVCYEAESWWVTACLAPRWFSTVRDESEEGVDFLGHDILLSVQFGYVF